MGPEDEVGGQGSESGNEEVSSVAEDQNDSGGGSNLNPAWNDLLEVLPSSLHSMVTPHLSKWDKNFDTKINEVHSQYAPYKDYLENEVTPDQINYALQVAQAVEQRPIDVIKGLTEFAKSSNLDLAEVAALFAGQQSGQEQQGQIDESEIPSELLQHPEFKKLQEMVTTMSQFLVQEKQTEAQRKEDAEIESELTALKAELGDFDQDWVLTKAYQDAQTGKNVSSLKPYVEQYKQFETGILTKANKPAPKVLASGGIAPDNQLDVKKMSDKERREYVVQQLSAAAQQNQ